VIMQALTAESLLVAGGIGTGAVLHIGGDVGAFFPHPGVIGHKEILPLTFLFQEI
jgi:hypothetical protein